MSNNDSHSYETSRRDLLANAARTGLTALGLGALLTQKGCSAIDVAQGIAEDRILEAIENFPVPLTPAWVQTIRAAMERGNRRAGVELYTADGAFARVTALEQAAQQAANDHETTVVLTPGAFKADGRNNLELRLFPHTAALRWAHTQRIEPLSETYHGNAEATLLDLGTTPPSPVIETRYRIATEANSGLPIGEVDVHYITRTHLQTLKAEIGNVLFAHLVANPNLMRQVWETHFNPFNANKVQSIARDTLAYARGLIEGKRVTAYQANTPDLAGGFCLGLSNGDHLLYRDGAHRSQDGKDLVMTIAVRNADNTQRRTLEVVTNAFRTGGARPQGNNPAADVNFNGGFPYLRVTQTGTTPVQGAYHDETLLRITQPTLAEFTDPLKTIVTGYRDAWVASHPAPADIAPPNSQTRPGGNK